MIKPGPRAPTRLAPAGLPGFAYFLMVLGGPWAFLPYLGRSPSRLFALLMALAALAPFPAVALLPFNWLFLALLLIAYTTRAISSIGRRRIS